MPILPCCHQTNIGTLSSGYLQDKQEARNRQAQNCNLETTKVLKFPKIFDHPRKKQYLCTLFVLWHGALPCRKLQHTIRVVTEW
jgi:hypothetical protein